MIHKEFEPGPDLKEFVQLIWMMKGDVESFPRERILPDGIVELVFHCQAPFVTYRSKGNASRQPRSFAISQMRDFIEIEPTGPFSFISVRFFPWGGHHFFDYPIADFLDRQIDANEIWPDRAKEIQEISSNHHSLESRLDSLKRFLKNELEIRQDRDDEVDGAIQRIRELGGQVSIEEICQEFSLSEKQLQRKFLATVGTTPKVFMRVSRFLHLCHHLRDYRNKTMTELTYAFGYFDQAHFIKDFRQFSGFTPKQFFEQNNIGFADV